MVASQWEADDTHQYDTSMTRFQHPHRNKKWGREHSARTNNQHATALSHSLIQLKPDECLLRGGGERRENPTQQQQQQQQERTRTRGHHSIRRWLFVYLPAMMVLGAIAYIVMELVIKHFAMRTLQQQIMQLPMVPPPPSSYSSLPDVAPAAAAAAAVPMTGPPPILPEPKAMMAPPNPAVDTFHDMRSYALNGSPDMPYY